MPNTGSLPGGRAGPGGARRCGRVTRVDLLTVVLAAMLCWASYTLSIWHNSRGAADSSVLGGIGGAGTVCGGADEELDFETRHGAEDAGLSVSSGAGNPSARRALRAVTSRFRGPFPWPASRGVVWAGNSAHGAEAVAAAGGDSRWARLDGDVLRFRDAGAVRAYADAVLRLIGAPVRTALDVGAMHGGNWATELLSRGVLTVPVAAPWGSSDGAALVELALERGAPAMLAAAAAAGVPSRRLPFPAGAFDMAHCGRCLVPWHLHGGRFLMEIDRVLRPGGYWVHSGAPANGTRERAGIEAATSSMCWRNVADQDGVTVWQKPVSHVGCDAGKNDDDSPRFCTGHQNRDDNKWDGDVEPCITPIKEGAAPPREATADEALRHAGETWKGRMALARYKAVAAQLGQKGRLRNLLDMNARLGGFAAAVADDPVWVMNVVVPSAGGDADTLTAIYQRGLIGVYHDWCKPLPTPAMSYDLLHADSLFTLYRDRCDVESILLEMDRILRPGRAVIIRDDIAILAEIKNFVTGRMRWGVQIVDGENGSDHREKLLFAAKTWSNDEAQDQEQ
ncbi:probable methyltransferase PMT16 [Oryza brachyantha]|uniref:probable methyltransferase PMT16 n=1 Tax=Oryza brachyantha TaxID=4533 RepID=UPI001AD9EA43|nr:probable methyltransferase PMT16 [Oryza brachyantha]